MALLPTAFCQDSHSLILVLHKYSSAYHPHIIFPQNIISIQQKQVPNLHVRSVATMSYIPAKSSSSEEYLPSGSSQTTPLPGFKTEFSPPPPIFRDVLQTKKIIAFELENVLCDHEAGFAAAKQQIAFRFRRHCLDHCYARLGLELDTATISAMRETKPYVVLDGTPRSQDSYKHVKAMAQYFPIPTSRDTRKTRHLLKRLDIIFSLTLEQETKCKESALLLLKALKDSGKTIVVISEGPSDRAIKMLERLLMAQYVDKVITGSAFGVSKKSGLFTATLKKLNAKPQDMIYVGDDR